MVGISIDRPFLRVGSISSSISPICYTYFWRSTLLLLHLSFKSIIVKQSTTIHYQRITPGFLLLSRYVCLSRVDPLIGLFVPKIRNPTAFGHCLHLQYGILVFDFAQNRC